MSNIYMDCENKREYCPICKGQMKVGIDTLSPNIDYFRNYNIPDDEIEMILETEPFGFWECQKCKFSLKSKDYEEFLKDCINFKEMIKDIKKIYIDSNFPESKFKFKGFALERGKGIVKIKYKFEQLDNKTSKFFTKNIDNFDFEFDCINENLSSLPSERERLWKI